MNKTSDIKNLNYKESSNTTSCGFGIYRIMEQEEMITNIYSNRIDVNQCMMMYLVVIFAPNQSQYI